MQGLTGLTGLAGYQAQIDADSQASPEERSGDIADPRHGIRKPTERYPWESLSTQAAFGHGPYGPANQMLGDEQWFLEPAGDATQDYTMDLTPSMRAGPWPKGVASGPVPGDGPDDIAFQLKQSMTIHGIDTHAGVRSLTGLPAYNDQWEEWSQVNPGHTDLQPIGRQAMSSGFMWGITDRTHSFARQNEYGYDSAHTRRRYAVGSIPGNTMWMLPGGRPLVKSMPGPARPAIGSDSPFAGQDLGTAFGIGGAILQETPPEYVPPPQPNVAMARPTMPPAVVEWY